MFPPYTMRNEFSICIISVFIKDLEFLQARDTLLQTFLKSAILKDCIFVISFHPETEAEMSAFHQYPFTLSTFSPFETQNMSCFSSTITFTCTFPRQSRASLLLCSNIMNTIVIQMICKFHDCLIFVTVQKIIQSIWNCQDMSVLTEVVNQRYIHRPPHVASSANAAILNF